MGSRRAALAGQCKARRPRTSRLPEEMPAHGRTLKGNAGLAGRACLTDKHVAMRRWLEESGVKLRTARHV